MLMLTILMYYLFLTHKISQAAPNPTSLPNVIDLIPPLVVRLEPVGNPDPSNRRSSWDIIWSCLSTILACTWVSIHPNIPGPADRRWKILSRRLKLMLRVIILPESVVYWAWKQYYGAQEVAKEFNRGSHRFMTITAILPLVDTRTARQNEPWTRTHGFFAIMGGFVLCRSDGEPLQTLTPHRLFRYTREGAIEWPNINEEEIWDRSKGDDLTKGIVVLQTSWFITTCLARATRRLPITQLEIITCAFAILNGFIYFFWWSKPLDVQCPIHVYFRQGYNGPLLLGLNDETAQETYVPQHECYLGIKKYLHSLLCTISATATHVSKSLSRSTGLAGFLRPLKVVIYALGAAASAPLLARDQEGTMRVATFFAGISEQDMDVSDSGVTCFFSAIMLGSVFGGIHLGAWSFQFPTGIEKWMWRLSSLNLLVTPVGIVAVAAVPWRRSIVEKAAKVVLCVMTVAYLFARILLLILALIAFRSLPPGALTDFEWTSFIPHIS